jgi:hypothetical protein
MERRVAAAAAALLAAMWLTVFAVKLSSGWFGQLTVGIEAHQSPRSHDKAVALAAISLALRLGLLCALLVVAACVWRGSRIAQSVGFALTVVILALTVQQAIHQKTSVGQWLGVALDLLVLGLIVVAIRRAIPAP